MEKLINSLSFVGGFMLTRFKRLDKLLLLLCIIASAFSVYLLYSMHSNGLNPSVISRRVWVMQGLTAGVGVVAALIVACINYRFLSKLWFIYAPAALTLSLLLFVPSLSLSTPGSEAITWLNLGFMQIQPSEFLTVAFIMTFATHICKLGEAINRPHHVILLCIHAIIPIGIMALQGNTGTPVLVLLIFLTMLFAAGLSWKYILAGVIVSPVIGYLFWNYYAKEYHKLRILVVLDQEVWDAQLQLYSHHQNQSLMALDLGGLTGQGLFGGDYITMFALHNDFIFAYIGNALGFIGCILTLLLILAICVKMLVVASASRDSLGRLICFGVFSTVFYHTVINVGMVIALTPVVGVQLPFISAGGSSMLSLYLAIGLVLSVWAHREKKYHMFYEEKD